MNLSPNSPGKGASLELRDVVKRYGDVLAVGGISLKIKPGEFLTLLGPSGSGKTTMLHMIAGFTALTSGEIWMDERPLSKLPPHRRGIGVVFQHYALFPHMTVKENVAFALKQRKRPKSEIQQRVDETLKRVGLIGLGRRYPRELSGGQQQRVAVARAIIFNPRLLLMDEPLGALDRALREELQFEIKRLHQELGITFIYVTHDQDEALILSDRIVVFRDGLVAQAGAPRELYERPASLFVARFLGDSNVITGALRRDGDTAVLSLGGQTIVVPYPPESPTSGVATLIVRPEHVSLTLNRTPAHGEIVLDAVVDHVHYLGASRKVQVSAPGLPGHRVLVRDSAAGPPVDVGQRVRIAWDVANSVLLADELAAHASEHSTDSDLPVA